MLKICDLSLHYQGEVLLFSNANIILDSGLWLLEGCNGCGKSTFLKLITHGINMKHNTWEISPNTVIEAPYKKIYLDMNMTIPNVQEHHFAKFVFKLNEVNVHDYIPLYKNRKLGSYSTGEQKAAMLHTISYLNPELLLLDEYVSNFDDDNLDMIFSLFHAMSNRGTIIIVASNENDIKRRFLKKCKIENKQFVIL